jgi:hypothetical protein
MTGNECRYAERADHICVDRDGRPIAGTDKVCFYEARAQVFDIDPDAD